MSEKIRETMKTVAVILMIALAAIAIVAVIWRIATKYIPFINGTTFYWANELQLLLLHWVVVIGMMVVYMLDSDIRITLCLDKLTKGSRAMMRRVFNLLDICVFFVVAFFGAKLAIQEWDTPTSSLMWSRGFFVYCPYVLLGIFVVCYSVFSLIRSFRGKKEG